MSHMGQWNLCGEQRNNCLPSIAWKTPTSALFDYTKAFDWVDHKKLWNILKEMEYQTTWPASWETCMKVRKQQLELDMEQQTGSK